MRSGATRILCNSGLFALVLLTLAGDGPPAGTAVPLPPLRAFGAVHPRLAPDGLRIAFSYQGAIWTLPRDGGGLRR